MNRYVFKSPFSDEMHNYLNDRVSSGFKERSYYYQLKNFDHFCCEENITSPIFTREKAILWLKKANNEFVTTHYKRINASKHFLIYLNRKGYDVFIVRDIRYRPTDFQPHIYTAEESRKYFLAVDAYQCCINKKAVIIFPVLFRILYCCGTRIGETLKIRKKDVDLDNGIIKLIGKDNCERYIVLGNELNELVKQFADKCFYLLSDDDYIFTNSTGNKIGGGWVYELHRKFLQQAGIPYIGNGKGPRIHDWRHHMAVESFKQMIDSGLDMYVALPILSAYLGHKTIYATERYIRLTMQIYPHIEEKFSKSVDFIFGGIANENN